MGARGALAIAWLLTIGACDAVFGIPFRGGPDGTLVDVVTSPCVMSQEAFADFETPQAAVCQGIGAPNVSGDPVPLMRIADGRLHVEPRPRTAEGNGCTVNEMLFGEGVFVQVSSIFTHPVSSVFFRAFSVDPPEGIEAGFSAAGGGVAMLSGGQTVGNVGFEAGQWWRLRPDRLNRRVVGEVSADGQTWMEVGQVMGTVPVSIKLVIGGVITDTTAASPGAATFELVNVCP